jgi:hypothetical protein
MCFTLPGPVRHDSSASHLLSNSWYNDIAWSAMISPVAAWLGRRCQGRYFRFENYRDEVPQVAGVLRDQGDLPGARRHLERVI